MSGLYFRLLVLVCVLVWFVCVVLRVVFLCVFCIVVVVRGGCVVCCLFALSCVVFGDRFGMCMLVFVVRCLFEWC